MSCVALPLPGLLITETSSISISPLSMKPNKNSFHTLAGPVSAAAVIVYEYVFQLLFPPSKLAAQASGFVLSKLGERSSRLEPPPSAASCQFAES